MNDVTDKGGYYDYEGAKRHAETTERLAKDAELREFLIRHDPGARAALAKPFPRGDALKQDGGKPRFELIDELAELALAMVLTGGATKYSDDGWRDLNTDQGRARVIGALRRHLNLLSRGDVYDSDFGGLPHSAHLLCNAMFLCAFDMEAIENDGELDAMIASWRYALDMIRERRQRETLIGGAAQ